MDSKEKHITVCQETVYDQELIYACVICLLVSSQDLNFDDVLSCELAAYTPSMFCPDGQMKCAKSKATLKKNLQGSISEGNCPSPDTVMYGVSAVLWVLDWPSKKDKLGTFVVTFQAFVHNAFQDVNVALVFDKDYAGSFKTHT